MRYLEMKGRFVVCEGLDASGKTTTIKGLIKKNHELLYSKGLKSKTLFGRISGLFPNTLTFLLEFAYISQKYIIPALKSGKTVIQDRYIESVITYGPVVDRWHNQLAIKAIKPWLAKPDVVVYFTVSKEERVKRLKESMENRYHRQLIENPEQIDDRLERYNVLLDKYSNKQVINTTKLSIKESCNKLDEIVKAN